MKDFCVGLVVGMSLGILISVNKKEIKDVIREGEKAAIKKMKKAKNKIESLADESEQEE